MTEIVKMFDRKSTFVKTQAVWSLVVVTILSFIYPSSTSSSGFSLISDTNDKPISFKPSIFSLNNNNNNNKEYKFSNILLEKKPFGTTEVSKPDSTLSIQFPGQIETNAFKIASQTPSPSVIQSASVHDAAKASNKLPGSSLWTVITNSFFKPKDQLPDSAKNSVFATPQLKTPRQAWQDLVANAKTGFMGRYEPFKFSTPSTTTTTTTSTTTTTPAPVPQTQEPNIANPEETSRSPRDSPWHVDTPTLAWDTMKVLLGVNHDLFSHIWNKNVVQKNHYTYSPIKNVLVRPFEEYVRFKQGVNKVYHEKFADILSLGLQHKDRKVSAFKSILDPKGWSKPEITHGWKAPGVTHHHHVVTDASLIARWLKAKINLKKHLFLTKWRLKAELLKGIPAIFKIKLFLIKTILNLIANKHESLIFPLIKILHNSIWKGKKRFLKAILHKKPVYGPYGVGKMSYPGTGIGYQVDITNENIEQIQQPPPQPSQQILPVAVQTQPIVTQYPLYSYPALPSEPSYNVENYKYGAPPTAVTHSQYNGQGKLVDLPFTLENAPDQYKYNAPLNKYDSESSGSEESPQKQSLFLSKLVQSFENPVTAERTEQTQQPQPQPQQTDDGIPKFSLKLLNSRFASS